MMSERELFDHNVDKDVRKYIKKKQKEVKERSCLKCENTFISEAYNNRMCPNCASRSKNHFNERE